MIGVGVSIQTGRNSGTMISVRKGRTSKTSWHLFVCERTPADIPFITSSTIFLTFDCFTEAWKRQRCYICSCLRKKTRHLPRRTRSGTWSLVFPWSQTRHATSRRQKGDIAWVCSLVMSLCELWLDPFDKTTPSQWIPETLDIAVKYMCTTDKQLSILSLQTTWQDLAILYFLTVINSKTIRNNLVC